MLGRPYGWLWWVVLPLGLVALFVAGIALPDAAALTLFVVATATAGYHLLRRDRLGERVPRRERLERFSAIQSSLDRVADALERDARRPAPAPGQAIPPPAHVHGDVRITVDSEAVSHQLSSIESTLRELGHDIHRDLERAGTAAMANTPPKPNSIAWPMFFFAFIPLFFLTYALSDFRTPEVYSEKVAQCLQERHPPLSLVPRSSVAWLLTQAQETTLVRKLIVEQLEEKASGKKREIERATEEVVAAIKYSKYGMARFLYSLYVDSFGCPKVEKEDKKKRKKGKKKSD